EVRAAGRAAYFGALHAQRVVVDQLHGIRPDRFVEARPPASGIELRAALEQFRITSAAGVQPGTLLIEQLAGPRALGRGFAQHRELLIAELLAPLGIRLLHAVVHQSSWFLSIVPLARPIGAAPARKNGEMTDAVRERYESFARDEAPGRSALYEQWAAGVAGDAAVQAVLARIPETHRQPPLVFAVTRMLGAKLGGFDQWREFLLSHADGVVAECAGRRVPTNEPLRLAPLLPVLSEIEGPIALLEIGASAGLCLYPDRYSYRFLDAAGQVQAALDPADGASEVVLTSQVRGRMPPMRMPQIVWRAGIDLDPLDARAERDRAWLQALVWPG